MIAIAGLALIATLCVVELNVEETTHLSESVAKWNNCAIEGKSCDFQGVKLVRYGNEGKWIEQRHTNSVACTNAVFSDPDIGKQKQCQWKTDEGSARQVGNQVAEHVKDAETAARKTEEKERTEEDAQLMKNFKCVLLNCFIIFLDLCLWFLGNNKNPRFLNHFIILAFSLISASVLLAGNIVQMPQEPPLEPCMAETA